MGTGQRESRRTAPSIKRRLVDGAASGLLQTTARNQSQLNITQQKHRREEKRREEVRGWEEAKRKREIGS